MDLLFQEARYLGLKFRLLPLSSAANEAPTFLPLDSALNANVLVPDEPPQRIGPAVMLGEVVVEFMGNLI